MLPVTASCVAAGLRRTTSLDKRLLLIVTFVAALLSALTTLLPAPIATPLAVVAVIACVAVAALPLKFPVIVLAVKLPAASLLTSVFAVLAEVALLAASVPRPPHSPPFVRRRLKP